MSSERPTWDVFIAHSKSDIEWVRRLCRALRGRGLSVFFDEWSIEPGDVVTARIDEGLRASRSVVVIISPEAMLSGWVREEYAAGAHDASAGNKRLIPVLLRAANVDALPVGLRNRAWIDFRSLDEASFQAGLDRLVMAIEGRSFKHGGDVTEPLVPSPDSSCVPVRRNRPPSGPLRRGRWGFVGRTGDLAWIAGRLPPGGQGRLVVLHGQPGVGKSALAQEVGRRLAAQYEFGVLVVNARKGPAPELARLGRELFSLRSDGFSIEEQGQRAAWRLAREHCLLIYDDLRGPDDFEGVAPPDDARCDVLITTNWEDWRGAWSCTDRAIEGLSPEDAGELIRMLGSAPFFERFGDALIREAKGIAAQLCPATRALYKRYSRDPRVQSSCALMPEAEDRFVKAWELLSTGARTLLGAAASVDTQNLDVSLLREVLTECHEIFDFDRALEECIDLHVIEGVTGRFEFHQLFARHVRESRKSALGTLRKAILVRASVAAEAFVHRAGDPALAAALVRHALDFDVWSGMEGILDEQSASRIGLALLMLGRCADALPWLKWAAADQERAVALGRVDHESLGKRLHRVGFCTSSLRRFGDALPWCERAVMEKEQGDTSGRVDHQSLGRSLHQVGYCHSSLGRFVDALPWYKRAVHEAESGGEDYVDHQTLGRSLHQVGYCLSSLKRFKDALPWYERAVEETERGDIHGRVNHRSLGRSLHQVAYCHFSMGRPADAMPWLERAIGEKGQGDIHGRIDIDTLELSRGDLAHCRSWLNVYALRTG